MSTSSAPYVEGCMGASRDRLTPRYTEIKVGFLLAQTSYRSAPSKS